MVGHVSALVKSATLHHGLDTEDRVHGLAQRFGTIEHDEQAVLETQPTIDQISEHGLDDRGVLGIAMSETDGDLRPIRSDEQGHD